MFFLKEHLLNHHYSWSNDVSSPSLSREPGRRVFDPSNGNQVLLIINFFGKSIGKMSLSEGRKIEDLIVTQLPDDTKSEVSVFNWLRGVYLYYGN